MAPTVPRELKVTYGGFVVGGTSDYQLDAEPGKAVVEKAFDRARVTFNVLLNGTTEAAFAAACLAVEAAFRRPFTDLLVEQGAATLLSLKASDNTALEPVCSVRKLGGDKDTGRSRGYAVTFECGLPADNVTDSGLRDFTVSIGYSPARRRTATFSGTWTAVAGAQARAKYTALIDAKCQAALTSFGGAWKLAAEDPTAQSYHDQTLRFSRTYHQSVFDQAGGGVSGHAEIREQSLSVSRRRWSAWNSASQEIGTNVGAGGTGNGSIGGGGRAQPLVELDASYTAWFDVGSVTSLSSVWDAIESWIVQQMQSVLGGGSFALVSSRPSFDMDDNWITAQLSGLGVDKGAGNVISRKISVGVDTDQGLVFDPVWTGSPTDVLEFQSTVVKLRTTRVTMETVEVQAPAGLGNDAVPATKDAAALTSAAAGAPAGSGAASGFGGRSGWTIIHQNDESEDAEIGIDGTRIPTTRRTYTMVERYRTVPLLPRSVPPGGVTGPGPVQPLPGGAMTA